MPHLLGQENQDTVPELGAFPSLVATHDSFYRYQTKCASHCKHGKFPDSDAWKALKYPLRWLGMSDLADLAIVLYYYDTHRQPLDLAEYYKAMTGYTSVRQELIAKVPARGTVRLVRKLSVGVNQFIQKYVRDRDMRERWTAAAEDRAV
ncbi:hypothetical protein QBC33DRAFT_564045 [Phialemonium atrogriseum]|uniref:Uncharacterized protein n=1 Tax=Phialemonium atrogriseum TaxID=1093897 RepID=A0AAJ0BQ85_9PEZI|nr:uncharacterized protein QBC33DRAFT_564045 [Phialemonium atrogriseum]KAK1762220.1 hypothetical protein QBC33DRAFT_564045 [Phialemonium atrogriseum]